MAEASVKSRTENTLGETVSVILQALVLALILRSFLYQPFNIPSGSMKPTLLVGDYLFVSKFSYGYSRYSFPFGLDIFSGRFWEGHPERGDVVVFKYPPDTSKDYIKRVIGLPGERVQMKNGILHINDKPVERVANGEFLDRTDGGRDVPVARYTETLPNGVSYQTLDITPNSLSDNTRVFTVPEGHYFMMGDNRDNSSDSRFDVGFVPHENLIGRASLLFISVADGASAWQFWRWPQTLRTERLFSGI